MHYSHRYMPGIGHQVVDHNGHVHSTHDTRQEADEAMDAEHLKHAASNNVKEHQQKHWRER